MRIGSLFAGIGGLELGLEWAGVGRTVWQVEREPFCRAVLAKHWPDAERFDDVTTVGAHNLAPVEVICGGFPCQDISYAGKGAGLAGARSGLWYEFARIVRELRPRFIVVENVAALLTRGLDAVLGTLASLGYDAEWSCVRASDVGARHRRDRVFIIAWRVANGHGERLAWRDQASGHSWPSEPDHEGGASELADSRRCGVERRGGSGIVAGASRAGQGDGDQRKRDGDTAGDCRATLANRDDGRRVGLGLGGLLDGERSERGDNADGCRERHVGDAGSAPYARVCRHLGAEGRRGWTETWGPGSLCHGGPVHGKATPVAEPGVGRVPHGVRSWLDVAGPGLPQHSWEPPRVATKADHRADRLKALGNAVVPQVAELVGRRLMEIAGELR